MKTHIVQSFFVQSLSNDPFFYSFSVIFYAIYGSCKTWRLETNKTFLKPPALEMWRCSPLPEISYVSAAIKKAGRVTFNYVVSKYVWITLHMQFFIVNLIFSKYWYVPTRTYCIKYFAIFISFVAKGLLFLFSCYFC